MDMDTVAHCRGNGAHHTFGLVLRLLQRLALDATPMVTRAGVQCRDGAAWRKQWVRLLCCIVGFVGEHGNVMVARPCASSALLPGAGGDAEDGDKDGDQAAGPGAAVVHNNPHFMRILAHLKALAMARLQSELTRECVLAMAKLAFRSNADVRACVVQALEAVRGCGPLCPAGGGGGGEQDLDHLVQPILGILSELAALQKLLEALLEGVHDSPEALLEFLDRHEGAKQMVTLYCTLQDAHKYKLLGKPSRPILQRAFQLKHERS